MDQLQGRDKDTTTCPMSIPNVEQCTISSSKVLDYLLNHEHPDGRGKARFLTGIGFSRENWEQLAEALLEHARRNPVMAEEESEYGMKYLVEGPIVSPSGLSAPLRAVWIIDKADTRSIPRLVTAYPLQGIE